MAESAAPAAISPCPLGQCTAREWKLLIRCGGVGVNKSLLQQHGPPDPMENGASHQLTEDLIYVFLSKEQLKED